MKQKAIIIGAGFGGLGAAALLSKNGYDVEVYEKNEQVGGRASLLEINGFKFDLGPSWYLMPDIFEHFFELMGEKLEDHITLKRLRPSYRVIYKDLHQTVDITGDVQIDRETFESIEKGSAKKLDTYLHRSGYEYHIAMDRFLYKNYNSLKDFFTPEVIREGRKLSIFSTMDRYVKRYFKDPRLQKIMEYPLVFLGSSPYNAPALYNIMSHVDFKMGVYYPMGGMYELTKAIERLAKKHGAVFHVNSPVSKIIIESGKAVGVMVNGKEVRGDIIISDADPHHTETKLIDKTHRDHSEKYWKKRTMAPSALLMYLGVDKTYDSLLHHNLVFSRDWKQNFNQIFDSPTWPDDPSFYVCAPGKTDPSVAPKGQENIFVLVPIASGLNYTVKELDDHANSILATMETEMNLPDLRGHIRYKKLFCVDDFESRFNSYKGTGLGLAHTLRQTAVFRPLNISKKVKSLYYVGANTHPGIGLPVTLISAELLIKRLIGDKTSGPLRVEQLTPNGKL
ncbi:MAG: phytoene desaturase family protein [Candidatus Saccharimonadales bacterium]